MKGILLLFVAPCVADTRDSEKYINPDLTKVSVTVNGMPNMLYNNIKIKDIWEEANCFFVKTKTKMSHMNQKKFYAENKFRLLVDLGSMADHSLHGSGMYLVNTKGYWKAIAAIKKLSVGAKVLEDAAKKWLIKQVLWQILGQNSALKDLLPNQISMYCITCTTIPSMASWLKNCWFSLHTRS